MSSLGSLILPPYAVQGERDLRRLAHLLIFGAMVRRRRRVTRGNGRLHQDCLCTFQPMEHRSADELTAALDEIRRSPTSEGRIELIVRRPTENEREVLDECMLDLEEGLVGDTWRARGSARMPDGSANPDAQLTLMNARAAAAITGTLDRWQLAGDQLYVDLDLSIENLPAGARLALGEAVIEVTAEPHTGCAKFSARFGTEALKFVNKSPGRELRVRGVNARVVTPGTVRAGDAIAKL